MRLMLPTFLFNIALWICIVVCLGQLDQGRRVWCNNMEKALRYVKLIQISLFQDLEMYTLEKSKT